MKMDRNNILNNAELLDNPYKEAFLLYYYQNSSYNEIAKKMNVSVFKAKGYLTKSMYLLRKINGDMEMRKAEKILLPGNESIKDCNGSTNSQAK